MQIHSEGLVSTLVPDVQGVPLRDLDAVPGRPGRVSACISAFGAAIAAGHRSGVPVSAFSAAPSRVD